jgi:hypothetical protein
MDYVKEKFQYSLRVKPTAFWLVAQCLNQLRHHMTQYHVISYPIYSLGNMPQLLKICHMLYLCLFFAWVTHTPDVYCYIELGSYFSSHKTEFPQFISVLETKYKHVYILQLRNTTETSVISIPFQHYNIHYLQPHHLIIFIFISMSCKSNPQVPLEKAELKLYL